MFRNVARVAVAAAFVAAFAVSALSAGEPAAGGNISARPLAAHAFPRGKTMFTLLSPDETGVRTENRYADPRMWGDLYQESESGSLGTGVAIGDYDGDGRADIFVVSKTESCRLFRNLGNFKFEDVSEKAGVADEGSAAAIWKNGVTFADVNNDGRLDIYVCRFNAPNLLYVNQGDGTFKESAHAAGLDVKDACVSASFCDYDRDGWLDVYIATNLLDAAKHPNGQRGYLFHANGDGTYTNVTESSGITGETQSHSATWWDYDNDGWPDLYVANDYGVPDKLYHNNRDPANAGFTNVIDQVLPHTSHYSMGSDLGDVNNDGLIDFLSADMAATSHLKDQQTIAESRGKSGELENSPAAPKYPRSALYLNTGTGRCLEAAYLAGIAATDWTWSVRFEDLDNDGRLDFTAMNGFNRDPNPDIHKRSMSAETTAERIRILKEAPVLRQPNFAFRNLGDLEFENVSAAWGLDQNGVSFSAAFGDLGGDGNLDLVYSNYEAGATLLRNDNDTGHRVIFDLRGTVSNRFGIGAVVKLESAAGVQVRQLVLARGYLASSEPAAHFGLGSDTTIRRLTVSWPSGHVQTFENLPVDQRFTITEPAGPASVSKPVGTNAEPPPKQQFTEVGATLGLELLSREEPVDEIYMQKLLPMRLNRRGPALAVGDIQGAGHDSIAVGGTTLTLRGIVSRTTSGKFIPRDDTSITTGHEVNDGPVLLFDADGNGSADLLVTKGGNALPAGSPEYEPRLFLNDGRGNFRAAPPNALPQVLASAGAVAAADFDRDGKLDVFIGARVLPGEYPLAPQSALLANRGSSGVFQDVTDSLAPGLREVGMVTSALWTDVDGDGWLDLLLALEWGRVTYFHNEQGKRFVDWSERAGFAAAGSGWWTSVAAADFNGDGQPDYVVGNVGLNTPYQADAQHPVFILTGDFRGNGAPQLIEGYTEGAQLFPRRSRSDMASAIPSIMKRFPLNDDYARATLGQILGEQKMAAADRVTATEFHSGVFLSQPGGTFRFEALPRIAQISPFQGLVAGDFDGDGRADIYAVQNSYAPIPNIGRFDGGLSQLLRGDGHGHFAAVPVRESNLLVPGDAKALVVLDLDEDGWPDFLVSRNNNTTLAFRNAGAPGRRSFRIVLRGPAGNPTAIGARVTCELADGSSQTSEVYAGSGDASQSSAALFFGYPESAPPKSIRVRWPSGETTAQNEPPTTSTLTLSAPPMRQP